MTITGKLDGLRVLLSGAIPDRDDWTEPGQDRAILEFVRDLTALVFKAGGRVVHGCHPSFTPVLMEQSRRFLLDDEERERLTLVMSGLWANGLSKDAHAEYDRVAKFVVTDKVGTRGPEDAATRNASLTLMRQELVNHADIVVAVGGRMHDGQFAPGVEEELELGRAQGLRCFLISAFGGKAEELARNRLAELSEGNLLSAQQLEEFATTTDVAGLTGRLVRHLIEQRPNWTRRAVRVFCSYATPDRVQVEQVARRLRDAGIDAWMDAWSDDELQVGVIAKLQEQMERSDVALLFWSQRAKHAKWMQAEADAFVHGRIEGNHRVAVLRLDAEEVSPFLRSAPAFTPEQLDELIELLLDERQAPELGMPSRTSRRQIRFELRAGAEGVPRLACTVGHEVVVDDHEIHFPPGFHRSMEDFVRASRPSPRTPDSERVSSSERELAQLGRQLGGLLFPDRVANALQATLDNATNGGHSVEVLFESADTELLGLPFEAARLPDDRVLALAPRVQLARRLLSPTKPPPAPTHGVPGPLKILIAIGAPDEDQTPNVPLDAEQELQTILDMLDAANLGEQRAEPRILEVGSLDQICEALKREHYHALHLSGHGSAGQLELEDEDGRAVLVTAADIAGAIHAAEHPQLLVFLACCHSARGNEASDTRGLAADLLDQGIRQVVAMQTAVSDHYATQLAGRFYAELAASPRPRVASALAAARRTVEAERQKALAAGDSSQRVLPEFATATLFETGHARPLVHALGQRTPLRRETRALPPGAVPMLSIGDLVGRRKEVREALGTLTAGSYAGVQLTGIGGIGKSSIAGRVMRRMTDEGWTTASVTGPWTVRQLADSLGAGLKQAQLSALHQTADRLLDPGLPDHEAVAILQGLLTNHPVLLVLDNFEDMLVVGGSAFTDSATELTLRALVQSAEHGKGRLLVTSRYPVPGRQHELEVQHVPPLSNAQTRKLLWRLDSMRDREAEDLRIVLRLVGGHPRMLQFADAILQRGRTKITDVRRRLQERAEERGIDLKAKRNLAEALDTALEIGAGDVLLDALLDQLGRGSASFELLYQAAVFPKPMATKDVARALNWHGDEPPETPTNDPALRSTVADLVRSSLLAKIDDQVFVHRWTAELLHGKASELYRAAAARGARLLDWRVKNVAPLLDEHIEAARLFVVAGQFDTATAIAWSAIDFLSGRGQMIAVAQLASEFRSALPEEQFAVPGLMREEADALRALGSPDRPVELYRQALRTCEARVEREPGRADFLRDLSVSYERLGDLMLALGQGSEARQFFEKALDIAQRLVRQEPDRADFLRGLSVSYNKLGDLMRALGQGSEARQFFEKALDIAQRLVRQEPDRADFLRDLANSHQRIASTSEPDAATEAIKQAVGLRRQLRERMPDDAIVQCELGISLFQQFQIQQDAEALHEAAILLVDLRDRDALEARFHELADKLRELISGAGPGDPASDSPDQTES